MSEQPIGSESAPDSSPQPSQHQAAHQPGSDKASSSATALSLPQILDATAACLDESGYDGTTIRRIAARLNCAVGSIYRYCSDKRTLLSAVTQRRFEPIVQAIEDHVAVTQSARSYASIALSDPQQYRLMFWLASMDPDRSDNALPPIIQQIIDGWTRQVGDPRIARHLWARVHGGIMLGTSIDALQSDVQSIVETRPSRDPASRREEEPEAGTTAAPNVPTINPSAQSRDLTPR